MLAFISKLNNFRLAIICGDCFEASDHKDHKTSITETLGFCDWGNSTLWKPSGFWHKHSDYQDLSQEQIEDYLTPGTSARARILFDALGQLMHRQFLIRETDPEQSEAAKRIIFMWIGVLSACLKESVIFVYLITSMLIRIYPSIGKTNHQCPELLFIDSDHERDWNSQYLKKEVMINVRNASFRNQCNCTLLSHLFRYNEKFLFIILNQAILSKMIQHKRFKIAAAFTYLQNYQALLSAKKDENWFINLGSTILRIPEVWDQILQNQVLSKFNLLLQNSY